MNFLRLTKHHTKAVAVALLLAFPFVPAMAQTAPSPNPSYQSLFNVGKGNQKTTVPAQTAASTFVVTNGNVNGQVAKARVFNVNVAAATGTLANGATYTYLIAPGRAGTITQISISASVVPIGGTNTVTITNNATTNTALSTANFDPTTITTAKTSQPLTLTATASDLILPATGTVSVVYVAGTQSTAAIAPVVSVEYLPTDY